jgi:Ca-activated chloride channel homolog
MFSGPFPVRLLLFLFLSSAAGLLPQAVSQDSDAVHIAPANSGARKAVAPPPGIEQVSGHSKPMHVDVDMVLVPVTVVDAANRPVTNLEKRHFTLYEGGEQQPLRYFSTEDSPISVGVLLDLSFSMKDKIETARAALHEFFANSNPNDDYFVIGFSDHPALLSDATHSTASIEDKLAFAVPRGNTALLDAIYMGLAKLRAARYQRRALVIISDGGDNHSRYTANELRRIVQETDVEIYALGIFSSVFKTYEEWTGKRLLTQITESTGGHTITVNDVQELPEAAANVSRELRNQYVLGYRPSTAAHTPEWRKIKVRVAQPAEGIALHVYSKQGYLSRHN